jgi:hypothetical protein
MIRWPRAPVPTYSEKHFERIAAAIGVGAADVRQYRSEFEEAARWYRLNIPPAKREGGPTLELRNKRPEKSKESSELRKQRSKKPKTISQLRKKANQVEAAARKLLVHLGVSCHSEAPDGPGEKEHIATGGRATRAQPRDVFEARYC